MDNKTCVCVSVTPQKHLHIVNAKKILITLLLKQYPVVTSLECLFRNMPKIFMP